MKQFQYCQGYIKSFEFSKVFIWTLSEGMLSLDDMGEKGWELCASFADEHLPTRTLVIFKKEISNDY